MPCPPDDLLGAYVDRSLAGGDSERIAGHIDDCDACRQVVIATVRRVTPPTAFAHGTPALATGAVDPLGVGTRVGRYRLRHLLGAGGMGHVYEAYDGELDRAIALKVLRPDLAGTATLLAERLLRESRLMAKVVHPAVITVHDVGRHGERVFIAMELVRGETLAAHVARVRPSWRDVVALYERAAHGLAAAHAAGIVHRDFKPDNVLVEVQGGRTLRVVVTDFGIARATEMVAPEEASGEEATGDLSLTATGAAVGTPAYMAPEQLAGHRVDLRADVFAFCASLWEGVFGARPFAGRTVDEIRRAMRDRPRSPRGGVPRRLVRALQRGLAIDPAERWPDLVSLAEELARVRSRAGRWLVAAGGFGLVGLGLAGALLVTAGRAEDPCAAASDQLAAAYHRTPVLFVLARDPKTRAAVMTKLDDTVSKWIATHEATCHADATPVQPPTVTACLDARRLEIAGFTDDVILDGPKHATALSAELEDPAACAKPPQSALFAKVPAEPELRRRVTALRYRGFEIEDRRDSGDFAGAIALAQQTLAEAKGVWGPVEAELLYALGTSQDQGGDTMVAIEALRRAAALGEATHHDYIAANSWIQLVLATNGDEGHPQRALEYVAYAEAALDRLGHPTLPEILLQYAKGGALVDSDRMREAEVAFRRAADLAEREAPDNIPLTVQGLGYLYEQQGRYSDAVDAYRRALAHLSTGAGVVVSQIVFRERLASNLTNVGNEAEAEQFAREAVALADHALGDRAQDRYVAHGVLAEVLKYVGKLDEAVREAESAVEGMRRIAGERSEPFAEALTIDGEVLGDAGRPAEAEPLLARACEIIAYNNDSSSRLAECWLRRMYVLEALGRVREGLALAERTIPLLEKTYGDSHPEVGDAYVVRAVLYSDLHRHAESVAAFERGLALLQRVPHIDAGYLGVAHAGLGKELWGSDRARARRELEVARDSFARATGGWARWRADLEAFVSGHR
jgi:tetratricopeptide (TPR) repeat protein